MARRIITREDVEAARAAGGLEVGLEDVVTEAARDHARRSGIVLREADAAAPPPVAVSRPPAGRQSAAPANTCIVTSVGKNRPFILAEITSKIGDLSGNILDISQRIVGDYFSTILIVDLGEIERFGDFKRQLEELSREGDYKVVVQHERIFKAMHRL